MNRRTLALLTLLLPASAAPLHAQSYYSGVAIHAGTLGVGADIAVQANDLFAFRGGLNFLLPQTVDFGVEDVDYEGDLPSPQYTALVDFHPGGSSFRISAGVLVSPDDVELTATPVGTVEINDEEYFAAQVGTIRGLVENSTVAPYVGVGYGRVGATPFGFFVDLGVAFHGSPDVLITADGPITDSASFRANLEAERQQFEDDISWASVYPVLSLGFSFGIL